MKTYIVRANEDLLEQQGNKILKKKEYYEILGEAFGGFEIIDEMGNVAFVKKEYFCGIL